MYLSPIVNVSQTRKMCSLTAYRSQARNPEGVIMRKTVGWAASWTLYYLSGYVDLARGSYGATWLSPMYLKLLNASDDIQTWGGGGGTWAYIAPGKNGHGAYSRDRYGKRKWTENLHKLNNAVSGYSRGLH